MFYAATNNMAVVGYDYYVVSFESKKRRDMFVDNEKMFYAETAKDMKYKFGNDVIDLLKRYKETVFDLDGEIKGIVYFTMNGDYYGIEHKN